LRWSADGGHSFREIVRQQWNFNPPPHARSRNITFNSQMSPFSNWSSCRTSVEERLALRSRVCGCRDPLQSTTLAVTSLMLLSFDPLRVRTR
jgi:hypothetical protein